MSLAQLSDPHVRAGDPDAEPALAAAVATVAGLRPRPDAVLVSGDLTHDGDLASARRVRELVAPLKIPIHVIPGNHDNRQALREAFGLGGEPGEPLHRTARCGDLRLVALDTQLPGHDGGGLGPAGLAWLAAALAEAPEVPTVVALHHPPAPIGLPALDAIGLAAKDAAGLAARLEAAPQVRAVVAGHVHRAAATTFAGRPLLTAPSVHVQAKLELGSPEYTMTREPPALLVHALAGDRLVSHVQPVLGPAA